MVADVSLKLTLARMLGPMAQLESSIGESWRRLWSYARLRRQHPFTHPSVVVLGMPELHGTRRLHLGRDLLLYRDLYLETRGAGEIRIGDGVVLSRGVHLVAYAGIEIGAGSMMGEYTSVRDANHRFGPGIAPRDPGHEARSVVIGRNVWIGRGVTVLPGVTIGDGAVVGANAVVTRDVAPGAVVAGAPARPIRQKGSPGSAAARPAEGCGSGLRPRSRGPSRPGGRSHRRVAL